MPAFSDSVFVIYSLFFANVIVYTTQLRLIEPQGCTEVVNDSKKIPFRCAHVSTFIYNASDPGGHSAHKNTTSNTEFPDNNIKVIRTNGMQLYALLVKLNRIKINCVADNTEYIKKNTHLVFSSTVPSLVPLSFHKTMHI